MKGRSSRKACSCELVKNRKNCCCVLHRTVALDLNLHGAFVSFIKMWSAANPNIPCSSELNTQELMSLLGLILLSQYQPLGI